MADSYYGINLGDPEVESSVQVGTSTTSTDVELRITQTSGHEPTRQEAVRLVQTILYFLESGLNTNRPVS